MQSIFGPYPSTEGRSLACREQVCRRATGFRTEQEREGRGEERWERGPFVGHSIQRRVVIVGQRLLDPGQFTIVAIHHLYLNRKPALNFLFAASVSSPVPRTSVRSPSDRPRTPWNPRVSWPPSPVPDADRRDCFFCVRVRGRRKLPAGLQLPSKTGHGTKAADSVEWRNSIETARGGWRDRATTTRLPGPGQFMAIILDFSARRLNELVK